MEAEKQLNDKNCYKEVKFNKKLIRDLTRCLGDVYACMDDIETEFLKT